MTDPLFFDPFVIQHSAPVVKHVAKHAKAVAQIPQIIQGFSMLTLVISNVISAALAGGLSWYVSHRGISGVKNDLNNAKSEIEKVKAQLTPAPVATVADPAVGRVASV